MSIFAITDPTLDVCRGQRPKLSAMLKYGRTTNADSGVATDVWNRATQAIWTAPTTARIHQIASTSTDDDGDPAGTGALTLRVSGLTSWTAAEATQDITMDGTTNVATNAYVIIHRMEVLTWGTSGPNVGTITATADTDGTVTAQIEPGNGQTEMAIYGLPSTHKLHLENYYANPIKSGTNFDALTLLLVNTQPNTTPLGFISKHSNDLGDHPFKPYYTISGPALIKVQVTSTANNTQIAGGFEGYLETL